MHEDVTADIDPAGHEGAPANLGLGLLSQYRIVADFSEGALWLTPYADR